MFDYLTGIYNITPTPFKADGSLDEPSLRRLTEFTRGTGVNGMTQLNNNYYTVANATVNTFKIKNSSGNYVNSTGYNNFSSSPASSIRRCQTATCEVVVTANAHGFANGDYAFITGVGGMTQINNVTGSGTGTAWQVASATANTFVLSGSTGPTYGAFTSNGSAYCTTTGCEYHRFTNASGGTNVFRVSTCVTERIGANAYTEAAPSTSFVGLNYPSTASNGACPTNTIQPLTSDRANLNARIAGLAASGFTAGQIGAAWGWYTLSPNFSYLWPSASQPAAYGAPETLKIMVLMTDGAFNTNYCNGVMAQNAGGGNNVDQINCNATNGDPLVQAQNLCTAMKSQGVIIYTVGFDMAGESQASRDMMAQCATDAAHAFMADDDVDDTHLNDIFDDTAKGVFLHRDRTVERHRGKQLVALRGSVRDHPNVGALAQIGKHCVGNRRMELHVDLAGHKRVGAFGETQVHRRETVEGNAQHFEDRLNMLFHAAAFGADGHPFAGEIGDGSYRRVSEADKTHGPGIGRRHHADGDIFRKRRRGIFGAADPVRRHEAELESAGVELIGVVNTRVAGLDDALISHSTPAVEKLRDRLPLGIKCPAELRSSHSNRHHASLSLALSLPLSLLHQPTAELQIRR